MYICICNAVTEKALLDKQKRSCLPVDDIIDVMGVGTCCGTCLDKAEELLLKNSGIQMFDPKVREPQLSI
jgi:bacterioferritin-associated ferredoxin